MVISRTLAPAGTQVWGFNNTTLKKKIYCVLSEVSPVLSNYYEFSTSFLSNLFASCLHKIKKPLSKSLMWSQSSNSDLNQHKGLQCGQKATKYRPCFHSQYYNKAQRLRKPDSVNNLPEKITNIISYLPAEQGIHGNTDAYVALGTVTNWHDNTDERPRSKTPICILLKSSIGWLPTFLVRLLLLSGFNLITSYSKYCSQVCSKLATLSNLSVAAKTSSAKTHNMCARSRALRLPQMENNLKDTKLVFSDAKSSLRLLRKACFSH